ncbi:16790_t:CDS:2, partial [Racocetra persica]
ELEANQRLFDSGEINESEYNKRRKSILDGSVGLVDSKKSDSDEAEIRSSYRKLASKYHPDKNDGIELEEWNKLSNAYQILSDTNSRYLYDNFGTVNNSLENKTSLNHYVGEMEHMTTPEQKNHRHNVRVSTITHYLRDKLTQFPKQGDSSEFESFMESLRQDALRLSVEPNGKNVTILF